MKIRFILIIMFLSTLACSTDLKNLRFFENKKKQSTESVLQDTLEVESSIRSNPDITSEELITSDEAFSISAFWTDWTESPQGNGFRTITVNLITKNITAETRNFTFYDIKLFDTDGYEYPNISQNASIGAIGFDLPPGVSFYKITYSDNSTWNSTGFEFSLPEIAIPDYLIVYYDSQIYMEGKYRDDYSNRQIIIKMLDINKNPPTMFDNYFLEENSEIDHRIFKDNMYLLGEEIIIDDLGKVVISDVLKSNNQSEKGVVVIASIESLERGYDLRIDRSIAYYCQGKIFIEGTLNVNDPFSVYDPWYKPLEKKNDMYIFPYEEIQQCKDGYIFGKIFAPSIDNRKNNVKKSFVVQNK